MERIWTIGAYGFDADSFFSALDVAGIDLFLDLRRRRGVRGSQYSFGNAKRLQAALAARGIEYRHLIDLAPDQETRALQNEADTESRVGRRLRTQLSSKFVTRYTQSSLDPYPMMDLIEELKAVARPILFCVEGTPDACHRSLVATRIAHVTGVSVTHLLPPAASS